MESECVCVWEKERERVGFRGPGLGEVKVSPLPD